MMKVLFKMSALMPQLNICSLNKSHTLIIVSTAEGHPPPHTHTFSPYINQINEIREGRHLPGVLFQRQSLMNMKKYVFGDESKPLTSRRYDENAQEYKQMLRRLKGRNRVCVVILEERMA